MAWTTPRTWVDQEVVTKLIMDTHVRDNLNFLKKNIAFEAAAELTLDTGAVIKTQSYHKIDTESDAATDDLDTITGGAEGEILILRAADADRTVVVKNGTGNIILDNDVSLSSTQIHIILICDGTNWYQFKIPSAGYAYGTYDRSHYNRCIYA